MLKEVLLVRQLLNFLSLVVNSNISNGENFFILFADVFNWTVEIC